MLPIIKNFQILAKLPDTQNKLNFTLSLVKSLPQNVDIFIN